MKKLKIGIFGGWRGSHVARNFVLLGCDIVALCDRRPEILEAGKKKFGESLAVYDDFDKFIEHDMDAVILANNFHEHAPFAIKCFERNIHVYSECISNGTMAEGVELVRAFEKSKSIYMLAENSPHRLSNLESKRVVSSGSLGKIIFAEGEYNHPVSSDDVKFNKEFIYTKDHWRNYLPRTYYVTHSLGPVMWVTGATPKRVTAFASFAPLEGANARMCGDRAAQILTQNDDGSVFKVTGCAAYGASHGSYRFCGTKGQIENLRGMGNNMMLRYNSWELPEGETNNKLYEPDWNDKDEELIKQSGHGGTDFLTARRFVECIKENKQPEHPFDIYSATVMSSVAMLSHRSMLEGGMPYDIPNFKLEEDRVKWENDRLSPFYLMDGTAPTLPCSSHPDYRPTEEQIKAYEEIIKS